ncbi:hypothetical protein RHMOL_Rhmol11G0041800 [Rhododendron molle]|uniref:Uncharacterized protein n=1 Tax=Rhododendron molle TaxID=49168 RepID=A0ACC0LNQ7_RHOML|nr:hypothetical protein RHMOL_Rhmol11G0041800 [Rhododendron molle]
MVDQSGDSSGDDVVDHSKDEGATLESEVKEETAAEAMGDASAMAAADGGVRNDGVIGVEEEPGRRALVEEPHTLVTSGLVGSMVQPLDPSMAVEELVITDGGIVSASGSGDNGRGDNYVGSSPGYPVHNPTHRKSLIVAEE